ncbi:hypothetical protein [Collimonas antrihumi]|uniref:hypothetical protein n=1 Tax=Collimonas antrihumi TaxID=1940615 RepID=UPI001B8CFB8A|nr:hypothetical protein [Collimonas antrihumi]
MKKLFFSLSLSACCAAASSTASAAPMDAFLSANQSNTPGEGQVEASYDLLNSTVDVFKARDKDTNFAGTNVGDYHGAHVRAGVAITPRLWVDGALWERRISYRNDVAKINTWQVAAQYKLVEGSGYLPSMALRLGAWGNYADALTKTSSTSVAGVTLNSVTVADPKDVQYQLDLINTWLILAHTELSMFVSAGGSRVSVGKISGTATENGCHYNVDFGSTAVVGALSQQCNANTVIDRFSAPNSAYGINVQKETQYNAVYFQAGLTGKWSMDDWQVRAGYQYQALNRNHIDDIIQSRGGIATKSNQILMGEIMYKIVKNAAIFVRGEYMSHQFTGEIPFAYNTLTAQRFNQRYGILSTGLVVNF